MSSMLLSSTPEGAAPHIAAPSCPATVAELQRVLGLLASAATGAEVDACSVDQLQELADTIADGRRALDGVSTRVGMAADRLAAESEYSAGSAPGATPGRAGAADVLRGRRNRSRSSSVRRDAQRAKAAASLEKVGAAVEQGLLGGDQLDSFARACRGLTPTEQQALNTDELVNAAATLPGDAFDRAVREAARKARADRGLGDTKAKQEASELRHFFDEESGMGRFNGQLDPERYERFIGAIERRVAALANEGGVTKSANLAAAALVDLVDGGGAGKGGPGANLTIIVDLETLRYGPHDGSVSETAAGHSLAPESLARLACDAVLQRMIHDEHGVAINVGRRYSTATDAQWAATRSMYVGCAFDHCTAPLAWCQLHHIHEWEAGGATDLCNLIPLCTRHHHYVHEGGWTVRLDPATRRLDIYRPDGRWTAATYPDRRIPASSASPCPSPSQPGAP